MSIKNKIQRYVEAWDLEEYLTMERIADEELTGHEAMMLDEVIAAGMDVWDVFKKSINGGATMKFAHMCALQQAPKCMTDREFFHGIGDLASQFKGAEQDLAVRIKEAKRHGYKPGRNDFYNAALARFPGDPEAFIPATGGRNHVKRLMEKRNQSCEGAVNHKGEVGPPPPPKRLGKDIAVNAAKKMAKDNPELRKKTKRELIEMATEKHGAQVNSLKTPESYKQ